jgi:hypothetical protein
MKQNLAFERAGASADHRPGDAMMRDDQQAVSSLAPNGADRELEKLARLAGELRDSLDKAQRRIERLLGERNQLSALLDKRDEQIQHLYRELGQPRVREVEVGKAGGGAWFWRDLIPGLAKTIAGAGRSAGQRLAPMVKPSAGQAAGEKEAPLALSGFRRAPLLVNHRKAAPKAVLAVVLFGLNEEEIRTFLPVIQRDCARSDMMPLLLTDNDAFEVLREHGMIFEYLPPAQDRERFSVELSWELYIQRRLAIIRQKWQPARVIALGQIAADMLRVWRRSPFEEVPLPVVIKD